MGGWPTVAGWVRVVEGQGLPALQTRPPRQPQPADQLPMPRGRRRRPPSEASGSLVAQEIIQGNTGPIILISSLAQRLKISATLPSIKQFQVLDGHDGCHGLAMAGDGDTFTGQRRPVDDLA